MSQLKESQKKHLFEHPSAIVYDRKFDTAMRQSQIDKVLKRYQENKLNPDDQIIFSSNLFDPNKFIKSSPDLFAKIMRSIIANKIKPAKNDYKILMPRIRQLINDNIDIQMSYMIDTITIKEWKNVRLAKLQKFLRSYELDPYVTTYLGLIHELNDVVNRLNDMHHHKYQKLEPEDRIREFVKLNRAKIGNGMIKMVWSRDLVLIHLDNEQYLLPRSYILLLHNKLCDITSILVLASFSAGTTLPENILETVALFIDTMINLMVQYQNKYFEISKTIESLCYAETLRSVERWKNIEFLVELTTGLEKEIGFIYEQSELCSILRSVDDPTRHELACLSKILGHPLVNMEEGSRTIHKKVTAQYELDYDRLAECECYIKQNYIRNHILTGRGWPPHVINSVLAPKALKMASLKNVDPEGYGITREYGEIQIKDYLFVDLLPNMKFNKLENMMPYLKDKTISICRTRIMNAYLNNESPKTSWKETRLLLAYLLNPAFVTDHTAYLDEINAGVSVDDFIDHLVCRVVPKEKEHKVNFRGFGCKTYHDRARTLAQEINSKKFLDIFSDEQAMTLSELDLIKRLHSFRHLKDAYSGHEVIYITLDASSWNNHFRRETVDDLMVNTLSKIFNHRIFSKTHQFYQKTFFYVPDGTTSYFWDGQAGGIEGLNQDTWVITYIAQIKTCLTDMNLKYHILCKGDDFRLAVLIPKHELNLTSIPEYKNKIVTVISKKAQDMGHEIKILESFGSQRYFMFSKHASIDKVEMPESFRKIQKTYGANNSFINTIDEFAGSTFSNAHSACRVSPCALAQYMVALFWFYSYLLTSPIFSSFSNEEFLCLSLVPSMCGGFPIIYLHNMYVRAESDLLPPFLDLIRYIEKRKQTSLAVLLKRFCLTTSEPITSFIQLFKDPYSLPSPRPQLPSSILRKKIVPALQRLIKNEHVRELFEARSSQEHEDCVNALNSANHMSIKILSVLYAALPGAIVDELVKKFESSRSVMELLILRFGHRKTYRILQEVVKAENLLQEWRVRTIKDTHQILYNNWYNRCYSECPHKFALDVRQFCWGRPVLGITNPPMHHLMSYTSQPYATRSEEARHFTYEISEELNYTTRDKRRHFASGDKDPFLGHITTTATLSPQMKFVQKDVILSHVSALLELYEWCKIARTYINGEPTTSNLCDFIEILLKLYTDMSIEELTPFQKKWKGGGTQHHHLRSKNFRAGIIPNVLSNFYTQFNGTSDTHAKLWGNREHFLFNFLQIYCFSQNVIFSELDVSRHLTSPTVVWGVTTLCEECNNPIHEDLVPVNIDLNIVRHVRFTPLTLTNVGENMKEILKESYTIQKEKKIQLDDSAHNITEDQACLGIFQHLLTLTLDQTSSLQARYGSHSLSDQSRKILSSMIPKSRQRDIGRTEIRKMKPNVIAPALATSVFSVISQSLTPPGDNIFETSSFFNLPQHELPWFSLLRFLQESDVLNDVMIELARLAGHSQVYSDSTASSCLYTVGMYSLDAMRRTQDIEPELVVLNNLEPNNLKLSLHRYLLQWSWYFLYSRFIEPLKIHYDHHMYMKGVMFCLIRTWHKDSLPREISWEWFKGKKIVMDFLEVEVQELEALDFWEYKKHGSCILWHYQRSVGKNFDSNMQREMTTNFFEYFEEVLQMLDEETINVKVATLASAVALIRSTYDTVPDDDSSEDLGPVKVIPQFGDPILFMKKKAQGRNVVKIPPIGSEDIQTNLFPDPIIEFNLTERRLYWEFINRPYGNQTNVMNILLEIYQKFSTVNPPKEPIFWSELGGGFGGGSYFFTVSHPQSIGLYMSKPRMLGESVKPNLALSVASEYDVTIKYEHIQRGIWDITLDSTLVHMLEEQPTNNMIFFNVDKIASSADMDKFFRISCLYYLRSRSNNGVMIFTHSFEKFESLCRSVSILSLMCTNVYLIQPVSCRCYWNVFIVCWGLKSNDENLISWEADPILKVVSTIVKFRDSLIRSSLRSLRLEDPFEFASHLSLNPKSASKFPAFFATLLQQRVTVNIPDIFQQKILKEHEYRITSEEACRRLMHMIEDPCNRALVDCNTALNDGKRYTSNKQVDLNTQAGRLVLLHRKFMLEGIIYMIRRTKLYGFKSLHESRVRNYFLNLVHELEERDRRLISGHQDFELFVKTLQVIISIHDDPILIQWWPRFAHGIEIMLSLIGYSLTAYPGQDRATDQKEE